MKRVEANGTTYYYEKTRNEEGEEIELLFLSDEIDRALNRMSRMLHYIHIAKNINKIRR